MSDIRTVQTIATDILADRELPRDVIGSGGEDQLRQFATDNGLEILEFLPPAVVDLADVFHPIAARCRAKLPEGARVQDWVVVHVAARAVRRSESVGSTP